jgi:hypothetical protein
MLRNALFGLLVWWGCSTTGLHAADLPPNLQAVKQQVIDITSANTTRTDNIAEVRAQLEPLLAQLEAWYVQNRPANEVALTQVPWKNLWYDDPDIAFAIDLGVIALEQPRDRIFQVVENGYYYNVSEFVFRIYGLKLTTQNYLKGAYTIIDPATPETLGQPQRNVIALTFVKNGLQLGPIPRWLPLSPLVRLVDAGRYPVIPTFGPTGVQGRLWNRYVDADLRISAGFNLNQPEVIDLYILRKVANAQ